jgi:hypothetical protein
MAVPHGRSTWSLGGALLLFVLSSIAFVTLAAFAADFALRRRVWLIYASTVVALVALACFIPPYNWDVPFSF